VRTGGGNPSVKSVSDETFQPTNVAHED
jgi:hypothetical protein